MNATIILPGDDGPRVFRATVTIRLHDRESTNRELAEAILGNIQNQETTPTFAARDLAGVETGHIKNSKADRQGWIAEMEAFDRF